jgi:5'-nucleotidase
MAPRKVPAFAFDIDGVLVRSTTPIPGAAQTIAQLQEKNNPFIFLTNGGGLRASLEEGTVTLGDVLTVLPFQNTLYTLRIKGSAIVAALEHGVNGIEEGAGRFPQVSGLRFTLDPTVAPGQGRVSEVEVREGDAWVPIDPAKMYGVATNNFMRNGGDGYELFATKAVDAYDYGPGLEEVLAEYLSNNEPYSPAIEGRITMVQ